jgi:hypothetical protein
MVTFDRVVAVDLAGYRFKFHYGTNLDWNSANLLYQGVVTEIPFTLVTLPFGKITLMAKAVDTSGNESTASANIFTDLGDPLIANIYASTVLDPTFPGTYINSSVVGSAVVATALDSFYGTDAQSFYDLNTFSFYESGSYAQMTYTTNEISVSGVLVGSKITINKTTLGIDVTVQYRLSGPGTFYNADADPFYLADTDPFYDSLPGPWLAWPGQITAVQDVYQFRMIIGAGQTQGTISAMAVVVDVPDIVESVVDLIIASSPTTIPYAKKFVSIKAVNATLQANSSGAESVEIDKSNPLSPKISAYNSSHVAVAGAKADIIIQGY